MGALVTPISVALTCRVEEPSTASKADSCSAAILSLFDHLVCDGEYARRNGEAERLGGVKVDHELELGRLHDRQVGGLGTLENAARVDAGLTIGIGKAGAVAHLDRRLRRSRAIHRSSATHDVPP